MHAVKVCRRAMRDNKTGYVGVLLLNLHCHIVAQAHPGRVKDMLAYMRLMVREGHSHGRMVGSATTLYSYTGPAVQWDELDLSLLTIISYQTLPLHTPCQFYQELDHFLRDCALAPQDSNKCWGNHPQLFETLPAMDSMSPVPAFWPGSSIQRPICKSWKGQCIIPNGCT